MATTAAVERRVGNGSSRRAIRHRQRVLRRWRRIGIGLGVALALASMILALWAVASGGDDGEEIAAPALDLTLGDYFISGDLTVPAGEYRLRATNVGIEPHDVGIRGRRITTTLFTGQSTEIEIGTLEPGTYELYCDISDHVARGMVATLTVTAPDARD